MKKQYIQPTILSTKMAVQQIICASDPEVGINQSGSVNAGSVESRSSSEYWNDDNDY